MRQCARALAPFPVFTHLSGPLVGRQGACLHLRRHFRTGSRADRDLKDRSRALPGIRSLRPEDCYGDC